MSLIISPSCSGAPVELGIRLGVLLEPTGDLGAGVFDDIEGGCQFLQPEAGVAPVFPASGKVHIVTITDKQYENIRTRGRKREPGPRMPDQLALF